MRAEVRRTEAEHGVEGYTDTQAGLEKISEQKAAVDEGKGAMLEEISKTVAAITSRVKEREAELVPRIQARKEAKQALLDLQVREGGVWGAGKMAVHLSHPLHIHQFSSPLHIHPRRPAWTSPRATSAAPWPRPRAASWG